ncbi:MAG: hypothetical protein Q8K32_07690 [Archangium sp.]|nr:hypothetical protein [Archangium sp.]
MRVAALGLFFASLGCSPECEPLPPVPQQICLSAVSAAIVPDASFVLEATGAVYGGTCQVRVDGERIELTIAGQTCSRTSGGSAKPVPPKPTSCTIPPLAAGAYTVNTPGTTPLQVATSGDSGVPACP